MTTQLAERQIVAFLDGEDSLEIANIIHSTAGAAQFGYAGPLVGGVTVYGWAAPALVEALGEAWLDHGWSDFRLRRPVYPGDEITTRVSRNDEGGYEFTMAKQTGEVCIAGTVGLGDAAWLGELAMPQRREPVPPSDPTTLMTPETLPLGEDMPPMAVPISSGGGGRLRRRVRARPRPSLARTERAAAHGLDFRPANAAAAAHLPLQRGHPRLQPDSAARARLRRPDRHGRRATSRRPTSARATNTACTTSQCSAKPASC